MTLLVDDLDAAVAAACAALRTVLDADWSCFPDRSEWSCRGIVEHVSDDLFAYAAALAPTTPETGADIPFLRTASRDGDEQTVHADPSAGNAGAVQVLDVCGGLLSAVARSRGEEVRGYHPFGVSDADGFAAMGTTEVLLHLHDVAEPLGLAWDPDPAVVRRVLTRLFPDEPVNAEPWPTLLAATGRAGSDRTDWRWDSRVRD